MANFSKSDPMTLSLWVPSAFDRAGINNVDLDFLRAGFAGEYVGDCAILSHK